MAKEFYESVNDIDVTIYVERHATNESKFFGYLWCPKCKRKLNRANAANTKKLLSQLKSALQVHLKKVNHKALKMKHFGKGSYGVEYKEKNTDLHAIRWSETKRDREALYVLLDKMVKVIVIQRVDK